MSDLLSSAQANESTRRDFIKGSTAAVVGGALVGSLGISRSAHAAGSDQIKIALVGCGGRGNGAAVQALATKGDVKLVAMADAFEDRLTRGLAAITAKAPEKVDVPPERRFVGFDAYQKAIDSGCDLVILATPPGFRPIHFAAAIKAGKHVFMEKPVATDATGVRQVLAAAAEAKQKNLGVGVGLQRRHQKAYIDTVQRLQEGAIGDIQTLRVYWNGTTPWVIKRKPEQTEMEYQMRNWYYFTWLCGDHIVEQHIHNMDVGNWVKNAYPVKANGMGGCEVRKGKDFGETFDHHCVEFTYADGTKMFSQCRHIVGCWNSVTEHAHGTRGTCDISAYTIRANGYDPVKLRSEGPSPYQVEHDDLFASIRSGSPLNEGEIGAMSTMTAILGRMATYSGKELNMEDALNSSISLMPQEYSFHATPPVMPGADGLYARPIPGVTKVL